MQKAIELNTATLAKSRTDGMVMEIAFKPFSRLPDFVARDPEFHALFERLSSAREEYPKKLGKLQNALKAYIDALEARKDKAAKELAKEREEQAKARAKAGLRAKL